MHLAVQSVDPLSLLLGHSQLIVALLAGAAWVLQRLGRAVTGGARTAPRESGPAAEDERTRQVREEVRRKIAERRSGRVPAPPEPAQSGLPSAPPLVAPRPAYGGSGEEPGGLRSALEKALRERAAQAEREQERKREAARAAQLERERRAREAEVRAARKAPSAGAPAAPIPGFLAAQATSLGADFASGAGGSPEAATGPGLSALLRDPVQARRAFVLREILGPPVALR